MLNRLGSSYSKNRGKVAIGGILVAWGVAEFAEFHLQQEIAISNEIALPILPYTAEPKVLGFQVDKSPANLYNRVQNNQLELEISGFSFGAKALSVTMKNKTFQPLDVDVPKGSFFGNNVSGSQPLITSKDATVHLEPGEQHQETLDAFCGVGVFAVPNENPMEATPYVMTKSGVLSSQGALWQHLDRYTPDNIWIGLYANVYANGLPKNTTENSAKTYYWENRSEFKEFDEACKSLPPKSQLLDTLIGDDQLNDTGSLATNDSKLLELAGLFLELAAEETLIEGKGGEGKGGEGKGGQVGSGSIPKAQIGTGGRSKSEPFGTGGRSKS